MKILVIRLSSLGDIVLTLPVLKNIKLNKPESEIYYLTKKQFAPIVRKNKYVHYVFEFSSLIEMIGILKKYDFDYIIDLHSNLRSFIFKLFLKGKKITYKKDSLYRKLFVNFRIISPKLEKNVVEKYLKTIEEIGFKIIDKKIDAAGIDFSPLKIEDKIKEKRLLVIQTAFLGDLMLTLPIFKKIKNEIKNSYLAVIARKDIGETLKNVVEIDEIIYDDKKNSYFKEFFRLIKKVKALKFDAAIIAHRSLRSALIAYFSDIKIRIGFDIKPVSLFYTHRIPFKWLIPEVERNLSLLDPLLKENSVEFPHINPPYSQKFADVIKIKPLILINPSSVWETKKWLDYKFAKLIERINSKYRVKPVIIGSKKERDVAENIEKMSDMKCINLAGETTLFDLMWIIKNSTLLITNDSGPMHIATAFGVGVVAIFGPTTRELGFFPYSDKAMVVEKELSCRPCRLHGSKNCPRGHFLCMKLISVNDIMKAVEKILKYNNE